MSLTPGVTPAGPSSQGISDVVSQQDLTTWAQIAGVMRYLTAPLDPAPAPDAAAPISTGVASSVFRNTYAALTSAGADPGQSWVNAVNQAAAASNVGVWAAWVVELLSLVIYPLAVAVFGLIDAVRKGIDPVVASLAVQVLNEFLGTDFSSQQLPLGLGTGDHLARAQKIGQLLYNQLESEFVSASGGSVQPSIAPAQTFSGLAVNFGLASAIMGIAGGAVELFHLDELREMGEEVARNIGLGRLVRRALTPLITTLVSNPAQWAINVKYLPTQFKESDLVNPFTATTLPHDQLYSAMHLLGYSDDKIAAFIQMHQKKLTPADVKLLLDHGQWTEQQAEEYIATLGWPSSLQPTVLLLEELKEERAWINKLVSELETEVKAGKVTIDEFTTVVNGLPFSQPTRDIILATVQYKVKSAAAHKPRHLSEGVLQEAYEAGLLTAGDLNDYWTTLGISPQDQNVLFELLLLRLARLHALDQAKKAKFTEQLASYQAKVQGQKAPPAAPIPPIAPFPLSS